jgi:hypothetical protein
VAHAESELRGASDRLRAEDSRKANLKSVRDHAERLLRARLSSFKVQLGYAREAYAAQVREARDAALAGGIAALLIEFGAEDALLPEEVARRERETVERSACAACGGSLFYVDAADYEVERAMAGCSSCGGMFELSAL